MDLTARTGKKFRILAAAKGSSKATFAERFNFAQAFASSLGRLYQGFHAIAERLL